MNSIQIMSVFIGKNAKRIYCTKQLRNMYKDNRMMELTMNMKGIYINRSKESNAQICAICELLSFLMFVVLPISKQSANHLTYLK